MRITSVALVALLFSPLAALCIGAPAPAKSLAPVPPAPPVKSRPPQAPPEKVFGAAACPCPGGDDCTCKEKGCKCGKKCKCLETTGKRCVGKAKATAKKSKSKKKARPTARRTKAPPRSTAPGKWYKPDELMRLLEKQSKQRGLQFRITAREEDRIKVARRTVQPARSTPMRQPMRRTSGSC